MSLLFFILSFFGFIVIVAAGIAWGVQRLRHRETRARKVCITAAAVTVIAFVAFIATVEPVEKVEEPPAAENMEPARNDAQAATKPPATENTEPARNDAQAATEPPVAESAKPARNDSQTATEPPASTTPTVTMPEPTPDQEPPKESAQKPTEGPEQNPLLQFTKGAPPGRIHTVGRHSPGACPSGKPGRE